MAIFQTWLQELIIGERGCLSFFFVLLKHLKEIDIFCYLKTVGLQVFAFISGVNKLNSILRPFVVKFCLFQSI